MSTSTTDRLYATLVAGLLAAVNPASGATLGAALGDRLYRQAAAKDAAYPFVVFSIRTPQIAPDRQSLKLIGQFEATVFHRPRSTQAEAEGYADTMAGYLRTLRDATSGLLYATDVVAESFPALSTPADASVVQLRVTAKLHIWPAFISSLPD